jgi:hypothetical protein
MIRRALRSDRHRLEHRPGCSYAARGARDIQSLLGEVHDCDVMLPVIERQIADLRAEDAGTIRERAGDARDLEPHLAGRAPNRTAYRGLEVLTSRRRGSVAVARSG